MDAQSKSSVLKIYYDGACHLCSMEINHYRKKDMNNQLEYVDISSPSFDAMTVPIDPMILNKYFHVQTTSGEWKAGVDAFAEIWKHVPGFTLAHKCADFRPTRLLMDFGYHVFARLRPLLPKKKCPNGGCEVG